MKMKIKNKQSGFSLTEVVVALGISAIVVGGIVSTLSFVNSGSAQYNLIQARNEILNKIKIQSMNITNLVASAELTKTLGTAGVVPDYGSPSELKYPDMLKKCIPENTSSSSYGCDKSTIEEPGRGFLFYLTENAVSSADTAVAGEDIYYKNNGLRCTSTESATPTLCPLTARVWFEPFCLNFASQCNKAMSLAIRYSVGLRSDLKIDVAVSELNGELYIPLQKGIQIRSLLSQNDATILPNSKGIFVVPKFYGFPYQTIEGLRLEAAVSNPSGLISMKVQMRSLAGTDVKDYGDSSIPDKLLTKTWIDVPSPGNPGLGAWSINLNGATPNQIFNFGTQINTSNNSRDPVASFLVGKNKSISLDPEYHWTLDSTSTDYIAPAFQSGFYQFRIVAKDSNDGEIESTNYLTVRIIGTPEYQFVNPNFNLVRDCVNTKNTFTLFVGDDENIVYNQLKLNGVDLSMPAIAGNKGSYSFDFLINQNAGEYPISLTLKNHLSDVKLEEGLIPKLEANEIINLDEVAIGSSLLNTPDKFKLTRTGTVTATYTSGNCCNATPKATWSFLSSSDFGGVPMLEEETSSSSANYTSNLSCTVVGNLRQCSSSISVRGIKVGPDISMPANDIATQFDLGSEATNPACQFTSSKPSGDPIGKYIPVVDLPTIRFYMTESLWLHKIPSGPATPGLQPTAIKPITPRVTLRMDFDPEEDIEVYVVDSLGNPVCDPVAFDKGSGTNPIDKFCNLYSNSYSGVLQLRRKDDNPLTAKNKIMYSGEATCPFTSDGCQAKFAGNLQHTICQRDFVSATETSTIKVPMPEYYTVPETLLMSNSPYGTNSGGAQNSKNDFNKWDKGRRKKLRCYDNWRVNKNVNYTFNNPYNTQDYYELYKYNNETRLSISPLPLPIQYKTYNYTANPVTPFLHMKTFNYPTNTGGIDYYAENIPFAYLVSQVGIPEGMRWTAEGGINGAGISSGVQYWEDVTNQLNCNGLVNTRLFRARPNVNWSTSTATFKNILGFNAGFTDYSDRYSYVFMCSYSRWNPSHEDYTNWED